MSDIAYALRFLRKRLRFTGVAVVVMALGISLTTTMYAIIEGVVFGGPDWDGLDRITLLHTTHPETNFQASLRTHDYLDWREQERVFDEMAAYYWWAVTLSGDGSRAERYRGARVTSSTFDLVGVEPILGRVFTSEDDFRPDRNVVVIGYDVWRNRYDSDPNIVGRTLRLDARPVTVIGVMPENFRFPDSQEMWMPIEVDPASLGRREGPGLQVLGRMAPGVEIDEVRRQLGTVAERLERQYPQANRGIRPVVEFYTEERLVPPDIKGLLYVMFAAVIGVLLIACANVANLLFALTMARGKELAVRTAMGADRWRVLRQLLMESLVLAAGGAVIGVGLSWVSLKVFSRYVARTGPPAWLTFGISPTVLAFVVGITFVAALAAGLVPALFATRADVAGALRDQGRGGSSRSVSRWSSGLVALEVAVSCALLIGAGLMVRTSLSIGQNDYGVDVAGVLTASIWLPTESYPDSAAQFSAVERMRDEIEVLPGARTVAVGSNLPGLGTGTRAYEVRGREYIDAGDFAFTGRTLITPEYFEIFGVDMLAGRNFTTADTRGSEFVTIVDRRFAEKNWPGADPLGRQIRLGGMDSEQPWMTVVGVVNRVQMTDPDDFGGLPPEQIFLPAAQHPMQSYELMLRSAGDPLGLAAPLREAVAALDSDIPVGSVQTLEERHRDRNFQYTIMSWMFSIFGIVALVLASAGLYAVMSFSVSRRKVEVGVRMAMGADGGSILRLIVLQGSLPLMTGLLVGVPLAYGMGRSLASQLYGVSATDPVTFTGIPLLLVLVGLTALLMPAGRASRIDPVVALRDE